MNTQTQQRPLWKIAQDIVANWPNMYFGAKPYVEAMSSLETVDQYYGWDNGRSIVTYFLSNAGTWRGDHARRIKAELKAMVGIK